MKKEIKPVNGHKAIYMSQFVDQKLNDLALRLGLPRSRIVSHLVCLADASQDLQVLIQKIDALPGECTKIRNFNWLTHVYITLTGFYIQLKNEILNQSSNWDLDIEKTIEIAKTDWVDKE